MSREEWIELNRETLENLYNELYMECVSGKDAEMESLLCTYEAALEDMGVLEEDFDEDGHTDEWVVDNWRDWRIDNEIDRMREDT